ncbi:SET domain-containing protein [Antarcticibacterium sp. 1MA-6-2]|uniref:SET domain-containing protein n=1 Tax=Antarcticibacterium sp. 1MA-6-2 TaxID=2908210 RepID=UPI001F2BEC5C|nr:SET domain-containing protein [Antarcticibacterium sp. 1MA-6-2]UJH89949.1 SET domain-containing protein [Antarcticibacterium sp. 1MA-6-2]
MMHPDTEVQFISDEIGYGVVATKFIPKGTITWVQDELDQVYTPGEIDKMKELTKQMVDKYTFRNNKGNFVMCWDISKYVNHSFKSNCLSTAYDFEIAIRDIQAGEELTDDYGYLNVTEAFKAKDEGTERTTVYPDDLVNFHGEWDRKLEDAMPLINSVDQPLMQLIEPAVKQQLDKIIMGEKQMESILSVYYVGDKENHI